ncbi:MAG: glycosyltransferase family 2 protein [Gammaproteobacteria bacterium]|nr:MAG: glycosyltransferase family 2 protein [Gammaproteobacteria bacterium]UCC55314.1 MAG: glycosyltransferase family 2 protein [Gammaproteobacteria bacterium]
MEQKLSIILPAKNEAKSLKGLLPLLQKNFPDDEIIVINDGSTDSTKEVCEQNQVRVISHIYSLGNGAAIKTGARIAEGNILVFMDADGQHDPNDISRLIEKINNGYDMVVGARHLDSHASLARRIANTIYNRLASWMTGYPIEDLTSGFRAARARHFRKFLYLLPNKFSYPTTSTMAFFRSGLPVGYVPIKAMQRTGDRKSHIRLFHDGLRFLIIIIKIGALFSPMRFFLPISALLFFMGLSYYGYTYFTAGRLTNMSTILLLSSLFTFLIGIVSEQISALHYKDIQETRRNILRSE